MTIDPAKFVVRDDVFPHATPYPQYPQLAYYPGFCTGIVHELIKKEPKSATALVEFVGNKIKEDALDIDSPALSIALKPENEKKAYGVERNRTLPMVTRLMGQYAQAYKKRLQYDRPLEYTMKFVNRQPGKGGTREEVIPLTTISNRRDYDDNLLPPGEIGVPKLYHPWGDAETPCDVGKKWDRKGRPWNGEEAYYDSEKLWNLISQSFIRAIDTKADKDARIEAAVECYYFISQDMPWTRRTATMARIALAYLEEKIGFEVPLTKKDINLNLEAIFTPPSIFKKRFLDGLRNPKDSMYFDSTLTSKEVMAWHENASAAWQRLLNKSAPYKAIYHSACELSATKDPALKEWIEINHLDPKLFFGRASNATNFVRETVIREETGNPLTELPTRSALVAR